MKKLFMLLVVVPMLFCACEEQNDTVLPTQKQKIVSFLQSTHNPKLIAEADIISGTEPQFYSVHGDGSYRYISDFFTPERATKPQVTANSRVTITFSAYLLTYAQILPTTLPFFSNDPLVEQRIADSKLPPVLWPFEPRVIDMQQPDIIKGLEVALLGCRKDDVVEVYMSFNMAYGDNIVSTIPRESPIAILFTVDNVE